MGMTRLQMLFESLRNSEDADTRQVGATLHDLYSRGLGGQYSNEEFLGEIRSQQLSNRVTDAERPIYNDLVDLISRVLSSQ